MWVSTPSERNVPQWESASNGFCLPPSGRWDKLFLFFVANGPVFKKQNKTKRNKTKQNKNLTPVGFAMPGI